MVDSKTSIEVWIHSRAIADGYKMNQGALGRKRAFDELDEEEQSESLKRKQRYYESKRWEISRLINMNYDNQTKFFTLTFSENLCDVGRANQLFTKFIKRLKYHIDNEFGGALLKYIATWERQKRGAIHYHLVLFNFPYIKKSILADIWGHGFVKINKITNIEVGRIGQYVSKYFAKELNLKESKKKAFFKSKNLEQPIIEKFDIDNIELLIETLDSNDVTFSRKYDNSFQINYNLIEDSVIYYQIDRTKKLNIFLKQ